MEHPSPSAYPTNDYFMPTDFMQYPSASHYEMQLPTPARKLTRDQIYISPLLFLTCLLSHLSRIPTT